MVGVAGHLARRPVARRRFTAGEIAAMVLVSGPFLVSGLVGSIRYFL